MSSFLWHASAPPNERSRGNPCRASARSRAHPANTSIMRISRDDGSLPMPAGPSCAGSSDASSDLQRSLRITRTTSCAHSFGLEPVVAPRSPTPTAGGSTPSEPARAPGNQSGHQHLDNCRDIVVEASATWLRHGSVAPWGAAGCRPVVFGHRGFDSLSAHRARHAWLVGAPGSYPGQHWVRGPGRVPRRRSSAG